MHLQAQGELQRTERPLDLALDGDGLLLVKDKSGTLGGTRTGTFHLTQEGRLQDSKGLTLQGWPLLPGDGAAGSATRSTGTDAGASAPGGTGGDPPGTTFAESHPTGGSAGTAPTEPGSTSIGAGTPGTGALGSGTTGSGSASNTSTRGAAAQSAPSPSAAFLGPLGALEDIQLVKPEPAPPFGELAPAGEPAPPPQLASPAEEVALSEELLPPEEPDPSSPYGTGWSMEEEAGGLYSFHGSMNYLHPGARTIYSRRTLMDSLGNEHAVEMEVVPYERSSIALASTDPSTYPQLKITFKREDGVLSIKDTGSTGLSCALDEATERLVVTFMDTGAQLTLDMSDAQATSSQDYPGASHGETVLWDMPPMIFEEATYKVRQLGPVYSEATIGGLHWTPGITVERSQDGLFAGLFSGISFKIELRFNEEGRVSGYKFTQNGGSTEDPSVGVEQTGPLIEGAHFVYNDTDYGTFNIDLSLVQIVVKTEPTPPEPEAIPEEVVPAGAAKGKILEKTEVGFAPLSPSSLSIDENGVLKRLKDDGDWEPVYLLACGQFAAMNAAEERNGVYYATPASGALRTGVSGKDGMGTVTSGTLERSTTDLAHELSEMIRAQHAYAANTKVLSTIEDMLTELERL